MRDVVMAIDQGTTGSTVLLLDEQVQVVAAHNVEFPNHFPQPGWVEHDVAEIWQSIESAALGAFEKAGGLDQLRIRAIGITNQRETSLFWDRRTGEPVHRALVWQDRRTADTCAKLKKEGRESWVRGRTGLVLDPYFSGTKAGWILDNVDGVRARAERGDLAFGTIDAWLAWKLCGAHATDPSNASRTLLFNIHEMSWDEELLNLFGVPAACLPRVADNAEVLGQTRDVGFLPDGIPVSGMAGDQQSALFGQGCFESGTAKCTYGTGAFVLMNTGSEAVASERGMLTTVAWRLGGKTTYALEGSAFVAGAAVQWLRGERDADGALLTGDKAQGLGIIGSSAEVEAMAESVSDSGGVVFVPALAGLGAPHWRPEARGLFTGITGGTNRGHICRAVLEGVALQISDILGAMAADAGRPLSQLRVDGGAARNNLLMQFQSDVLSVDCVRPTVLETTALGAAFLGGLGAGFWSSTDAIRDAWVMDRRFKPQMETGQVEKHLAAWRKAVRLA